MSEIYHPRKLAAGEKIFLIRRNVYSGDNFQRAFVERVTETGIIKVRAENFFTAYNPDGSRRGGDRDSHAIDWMPYELRALRVINAERLRLAWGHLDAIGNPPRDDITRKVSEVLLPTPRMKLQRPGKLIAQSEQKSQNGEGDKT